jgi:hypothetical protein
MAVVVQLWTGSRRRHDRPKTSLATAAA